LKLIQSCFRTSGHNSFVYELVQDSIAGSKTAHFSPLFTFFQLRSTGYAPSETQKLTKMNLFLPSAENPEQALGLSCFESNRINP
jgi:hypothetical protein